MKLLDRIDAAVAWMPVVVILLAIAAFIAAASGNETAVRLFQ